MLFAHDTEAALLTAASLVNADLAELATLQAWLDEQRMTGRRDGTEAELIEVLGVRAEVEQLWRTRDPDQLVAAINELLARTGAMPRLVNHDGWGWHLHVTDPEASVADRLAAEVAMALADVVRSDALDRLRACAAPACEAVLVDLSRNSSKRYCDTGCGNRTHVAAYRSRRRDKTLQI